MIKILNNWSVITPPDPYRPPEARTSHLHGIVYNHGSFKDGEEVTTSAIVGIKDSTILTRSGSEYVLAAVNPSYEAAFPNAKVRIIDHLNKLYNK